MKKILALLLILTTGLLLPACGKNEEQPSTTNVTTAETTSKISVDVDKEKLEKTLTGYFSALKSHNLAEIKKYIDKGMYPTDEDSYKKQFVDTVIDCKLKSVDYSTLKDINAYRFSVNVDFMINYSDDYIPVGIREVGVNNLTEKFTIEGNIGGNPNYSICSMSPDLSD